MGTPALSPDRPIAGGSVRAGLVEAVFSTRAPEV
jgi:hypothetical protein